MTQKNLLKRIEINSRVMLGKPVIRGTRITVEQILNKLAQNISVEKIIEDYPHLKVEDVQASIAYAAESISREEMILLSVGNK